MLILFDNLHLFFKYEYSWSSITKNWLLNILWSEKNLSLFSKRETYRNFHARIKHKGHVVVNLFRVENVPLLSGCLGEFFKRGTDFRRFCFVFGWNLCCIVIVNVEDRWINKKCIKTEFSQQSESRVCTLEYQTESYLAPALSVL